MDIDKSFASLSAIANLPNNWNMNGAPAFSKQLIDLCRSVVNTISHQPDIFPTAQESVQMEWNNANGDYLEIEIYENGVVEASMRRCDGSWIEEDLDTSMIGEYVERFFD